MSGFFFSLAPYAPLKLATQARYAGDSIINHSRLASSLSLLVIAQRG